MWIQKNHLKALSHYFLGDPISKVFSLYIDNVCIVSMVYTMKHACSIMCWAWHEHDQPRDTRVLLSCYYS